MADKLQQPFNVNQARIEAVMKQRNAAMDMAAELDAQLGQRDAQIADMRREIESLRAQIEILTPKPPAEPV